MVRLVSQRTCYQLKGVHGNIVDNLKEDIITLPFEPKKEYMTTYQAIQKYMITCQAMQEAHDIVLGNEVIHDNILGNVGAHDNI